MIFILSKLIEAALLPSNILAFVGLGGILALALGWRRFGVSLMIFSIALLIIIGWSPVGPLALMVLENRFPKPDLPEDVTGIVMLGGAVDTHVSTDRNSPALTDAAERIVETAELARRYPHARVILSGGLGEHFNGQTRTESAIAKDVLLGLGVPGAQIELEERSRNTWENAVDSAKVAKAGSGDHWLLITSAYQMPRAVASFRAAHFPVIPYPVDYRTRAADLHRPQITIAGGLAIFDLAIHEWAGLAEYRLTRTSSLFPKP